MNNVANTRTVRGSRHVAQPCATAAALIAIILRVRDIYMIFGIVNNASIQDGKRTPKLRHMNTNKKVDRRNRLEQDGAIQDQRRTAEGELEGAGVPFAL